MVPLLTNGPLLHPGGKTRLHRQEALVKIPGPPQEASQPTTTAGVMTLAVEDMRQLKMTIPAVVASKAAISLAIALSHVMTTASTVVNQATSPATALSQRNLVGMIVLAASAMKSAILLAIAPQAVLVEEIGHVTNVARLGISHGSVPLPPSVPRLEVPVVA